MTRQLSSPLERSVWQLCKALLRIVIGSEFEGSLPHSCASKCAGRETKARNYMPYEQPLGEGARRRRRIDVPRRGTPFYAATSMATVQSATPYRQRKRSREIFVALVCDVMSRLRNESTILHMIRVAPWRRGAPKAQDRCASKRHSSTQRPICQLCKAPLRIVIGSEAVGFLPHSYASKCVGRETKARYYMQYE